MDAKPPKGALVLAAAVLLAAPSLAGCFGGPLTSDEVGSRARDFASSATYTKLIVEVDWLVEGGTSYEPSASVLSFLDMRLEARLSKPGGVTVQLGNAITAARSAYGPSELRDLERANREHRSGGDTAALWIVFANRYSQGGMVVGVAFTGSACAVFSATIAENTGLFVTQDSVEQVVALHEVGHLLGLVNLGTPMAAPHEDAAHPGHSSNPNSVMYWQVEGPGIFDILRGGGSPDDFDAADAADLRAIGGK